MYMYVQPSNCTTDKLTLNMVSEVIKTYHLGWVNKWNTLEE